jgi:4-hydroxybenzoate polyprenyltransferase
VPAAPSLRPWPLRLLDALLYSSGWLALAAAAQTWVTLAHFGALSAAAYRLVWMVFGATLLVYNLDAALPFKHQQPAGTSARKAWQQRHRRLLAGLAAGAAVGAGAVFLRDAWWRYVPQALPLAVLALLYSWPLARWHGRPRALRDVPLLKVFLIAGVWTMVTAGLPTLLLHQPIGAVAGLLGQRFCFVLALAIVFDIRDYSRDRRAGTRTFPGLLGVAGARWVALAALAVSAGLGLAWGAPWRVLLLSVPAAAVVILMAEESRGDYFFALVTDGVLLLPVLGYVL